MRTRRQTRGSTTLAKSEVIKSVSATTASSVASSTLDEQSTIAEDAADDDDNVASWSGWAEVENDPVIFTTLLREWGVPNVQVHEVVPLESLFDYPTENTYGLIFLSRWTASEESTTTADPPPDVWFANQVSSFSCASVALMNIINNRSGLDLGSSLNEFRAKTIDMTPKDRGIALDRYDHVRDVHNSFSTSIDRMVVDHRLKQDAQAAEKKKKAKASKKRKFEDDDEDFEDEENGFHFVAYVPAGSYVWEMDGMELSPQKIGRLDPGTDWIMMTLPVLQATWENATSKATEFSLLSLTSATASSDVEADRLKMGRAREDWGPFLAHLMRLHADKGDLKELLQVSGK
ncbi:hypothetical protein B0A52_01180 [Exophiala mesophila]|uniref:ubiquitinyl hydrolase 1 n=1 Tax=Exophiala mesophila TaxID=212818 RepID=A0A438NGP7_EXOME|nr:hypothetical protein B0A52_01180 [Exophiala mesophila]